MGSPLFATPEIAHECRPDGTVVLRSTREPGPAPRSLGALLERWAAADGRRVFMAERDPAGAWRRISYAEAARAVNGIAQSLLDRRLGPERPVLILADNGIDHALVMLGALHVGVPAVPVSTAYARLNQDFG
ncbi:MAG TPA: AMP-binding protein, partial [Hyphomicrobiaceae bacterium]|nr:AMP-binding protein [Hyphomicrobiaceae bacterium]